MNKSLNRTFSQSLNKTQKKRILFARALHTWSYAELIVIPSLHSWRFCLSSTPMKGEPRREWGGNNEKPCRSFANAFTGSPHVYPLAKQTASHAGYVIPSSNATAFHAYHSRGDAGVRMRKALAIKQGRLLITFFRSLHCGLETTCYSITWDTRV